MGSKQDVRWLALSDNAGNGLLFIATDTMAAAAGHYRPSDFFTVTERIKHPYQFHTRENTVVYLDARQRPLGNASCGPEPMEKYELYAETTAFNFMILPLETASNEQLSIKARVKNPVCSPVKIERDSRTGKISLSSATSGATIIYSINSGEQKTYTQPFDFSEGGLIETYCRADNQFNSMTTSAYFGFFVDKSNWKIVSSSSQGSNNYEFAKNAIDGDPNTYWHTKWGSGEPKHPHEIVVDMSQYYKVEAFVYSGRMDMENGRVKDYEIYFSNNPEVWGNPVAKGQFANVSSPQRVEITSVPIARYFKLIARSEVNNRVWTSAGELGIEASAVLESAEVPKQVIFPDKEYRIKHVASGLYLQRIPNTGTGLDGGFYYGDFYINPLQNDDKFTFIFRAVPGFKSVYKVENTGKYIFNDGGGWRCEWGSYTDDYGRIQVESNIDGAFKLRGFWQKDLYVNLDSETPNSFIFSDKPVGTLWQVEEKTNTAISLFFFEKGIGQVYPNPAEDYIIYFAPENGLINFYDMLGRKVGQYAIVQGENRITVANYSNGEYLFEFFSEKVKQHGMWIKK
jgi:beta-galactosidase